MKKAPVIVTAIRGYQSKDAFNIAWDMQIDDPVGLLREPTNHYDSNAVIVTSILGDPIAYVQRERAAELAPWMDKGWIYSATVIGEPICNYGKMARGIKKDSIVIRCVPINLIK